MHNMMKLYEDVTIETLSMCWSLIRIPWFRNHHPKRWYILRAWWWRLTSFGFDTQLFLSDIGYFFFFRLHQPVPYCDRSGRTCFRVRLRLDVSYYFLASSSCEFTTFAHVIHQEFTFSNTYTHAEQKCTQLAYITSTLSWTLISEICNLH